MVLAQSVDDVVLTLAEAGVLLVLLGGCDTTSVGSGDNKSDWGRSS